MMSSSAGPVEPTVDDAPFWAACAQRRLVFQRCTDCRAFRHPPLPRCPQCQSAALDWVDAPGRGRLFSFTVTRRAFRPDLSAAVPYVVALVHFPDCGDVRLVTNVVDVDPSSLDIGMQLELHWAESADGLPLPIFRPLLPPPEGSRT